jgi:hypothetical protein
MSQVCPFACSGDRQAALILVHQPCVSFYAPGVIPLIILVVLMSRAKQATLILKSPHGEGVVAAQFSHNPPSLPLPQHDPHLPTHPPTHQSPSQLPRKKVRPLLL